MGHGEEQVNIYIGNLSREVNEKDLRYAFQNFGQVTSVNIIRSSSSGESKQFGFVEMPTKAEAEAAIESLNDRELKGRRLIVNETRPRSGSRGGNRKPDEGYLGGGRRLW